MLDRVPYDIFSEIIKLSYNTQDAFSSFRSFRDFDEVHVPPIEATHVCRSWRTALLSNPTMWTYITLVGGTPRLDQFDQILHRSGTCPLHLFIDLHADHIDPDLIIHHYYKLSVISQQMHRCRQLRMVVSPQLAPFVFHCLDKPAPILQRLYLHTSWEYGWWKYEDVLPGFHEILFSGHAPNLKYLNIQIVDSLVNFQLSIFKNLSSLHLIFTDVTNIKNEILLDVLQSSPHLHTLVINILMYTRVYGPVAPVSFDRRVTLSHLRELSLRGSCRVSVVDLFLGHLDFPAENVKFDIKCEDFFYKISTSTLLLHILSYRRFTCVSVSRTINHFFLIIQFSEKMDDESTGSIFKVASETSLRSQDGLLSFLRTFNVLDVTHMSLERIPFNNVILRRILASLKNLQYLRVRHGNYNEWTLSEGEAMTYGSYLKALLPPKPPSPTGSSGTRPSSETDTDDSEIDLDTDDSDIDSDTDDSEINSDTEAYQGQLFPCPSLRTLELLLSDDDLYPVTLEEAHLPALSRCSKIRERAGYPLRCIADCGRLSDLAEDIKAWLRVHGSGLSIEVRVNTGVDADADK